MTQIALRLPSTWCFFFSCYQLPDASSECIFNADQTSFYPTSEPGSSKDTPACGLDDYDDGVAGQVTQRTHQQLAQVHTLHNW